MQFIELNERDFIVYARDCNGVRVLLGIFSLDDAYQLGFQGVWVRHEH